jgi:hypothetical protein
MTKNPRQLKKLKNTQPKTLTDQQVAKKEQEAWQQQLFKDGDQAVQVMSDFGSGGERKHLPFRPYSDTHDALMRLALDLTNKTGGTVKAHDLLIEAVNMVFKKYHVDHVAQRPCRSSKVQKLTHKA